MPNFQAISNPEFLNLQPLDVSPFISSVDIKVFYLGKNDNGSFIDKETATKMGKTLRGNPIVGWYDKETQDFVDHGEEWILNGKGFTEKCLTQPYGFVAPDAEVWFQKFSEIDRNTNEPVVREYLMTKGYLWTGQFEEAAQAYKEGKGQSMELHEPTLEGSWDLDPNSGYELFIINDAKITKLCMLGDTVEPCFEGASVTASTSFSFGNDNWENKMHTMIKELKFALEGDKAMTEEKNLDELVQNESNTFENHTEGENPSVETSAVAPETTFDDGGEGGESGESGETAESGETTETSETGNTETGNGDNSGSDNDDDKGDDDDDQDDDEPTPEEQEELRDGTMNGAKKEFSQEDVDALQSTIDELQAKYTDLEEEAKELREFKLSVERVEKTNKIAEFTSLTEEDVAEIKENIDTYSLDDIVTKLATLCYKKGVNFTKEIESEEDSNESEATFNVNTETYLPEWVRAVKETQESMN